MCLQSIYLFNLFRPLLKWNHLWYLSCSRLSIANILFFKATIKADDCLDLRLPNLFSSSAVTFSLDSSRPKSSDIASLGLSFYYHDETFLVIFLVLFSN